MDVLKKLSRETVQAASNEDLLNAFQSSSQWATRAGGERWRIIGANLQLVQAEILRRMA